MVKGRVVSQIAKFNSRPLKFKNCPDFPTCRWCVTYRWKFLNKGYNFSLNLISIGGLHTKLWPTKIGGVPTLGISGLPFGSPGTKWHLGAGHMAKHKVYYKGEGGGFVLSLVHCEFYEFVFAHGLSVHQSDATTH
jgi:hypothetical protein